MDKNMINIDDLVRQRLNGGEEQERAGAWLQMRDLLDDKMPVRAAGGYNWRRMLTAATGLLLFASLTVGGYKMYNSYRPDEQALQAGNVNSGNAQQYTATNSGRNNNAQTANEALTTASENRENITSENSNNESSKETNDKLKSNDGVAIAKKATSTAVISNTQKSNTVSKSKTQALSATTLNNTTHNTATSLNSNVATTNTTTPNNNNTNTSLNSSTPGSTAASNQFGTVTKTTKGANATPSAPVNPSLSATPLLSNEKTTTTAENVKIVQDNTVVKSTVTKDSIPKIAITETVKVDPIRRKLTATQDTTSIGKMAIEKETAAPLLASAQKKAIGKSAEPVPQAKTSVAETKGSAAALKARTDKTSFLESLRLKERFLEAEYRLGQVKIHTGIMGGLNNYQYPSNSMLGIHLGFRGTALFDEKWSLFAEMKYMQRFNRDHSIKDNYWKVGNVVGTQYQANEIEHFFKFSALHTLEMPVAVRYALFKQLHIFAGGNLVYNFKINAEEITRVSEEKLYNGNGTGLQTKPTINLDHFGSRFSAGYVLGLGYQLSPNFDVDLRMTRNFWDNAAGSGNRKISDQLLYRPSFQFSIGYKFLRKNRVPPAK